MTPTKREVVRRVDALDESENGGPRRLGWLGELRYGEHCTEHGPAALSRGEFFGEPVAPGAWLKRLAAAQDAREGEHADREEHD